MEEGRRKRIIIIVDIFVVQGLCLRNNGLHI